VYVFSSRWINDSTDEKSFRKTDSLSCITGYLLLLHVVCSWALWTIAGGIRGVRSVMSEAEIAESSFDLSGIGRSVLEAASFASSRDIHNNDSATYDNVSPWYQWQVLARKAKDER
jgi:hypothetical protein